VCEIELHKGIFVCFFGGEEVMWREEEEAVQIRLLVSSLRWIYQDESTVRCRRINLRFTVNGLSLYWNLMFTGSLI